MKLTDYAKSRKIRLSDVREAAREHGFHSDHFNAAVTAEQEAILDGWFSVSEGGPYDACESGNRKNAATPDKEPLPEYFVVDLPLCLLGKRTIHTTRGETLEARKAAAFETYKQSGGILGSRYVPSITPVDDPDGIDQSELLEQKVV